MFLVSCALVINLSKDLYMTAKYTGVLISKQGDNYIVDFTGTLKKRFGRQAAPYVKKVNGNECLFIGGPYGR